MPVCVEASYSSFTLTGGSVLCIVWSCLGVCSWLFVSVDMCVSLQLVVGAFRG